MTTDAALEARLASLEHRLGIVEDEAAIRKLQHAYGYYIDKCLYDEAAALFSRDARLKFLNGVWVGQAGVRRLYCEWFRTYFTGGHNGAAYGFLLDHLLMQDVIHVAEDRQSARGRFRAVMQGGVHESRPQIPGFPSACWEGGIYEHGYIKEDGVWKLHRFDYTMLWQADYHKGWDRDEVHLKQFERTFPEDPWGPDELVEAAKPVWPHTQVVPFHYPHPVTGEMWVDQGIADPRPSQA